MLQNTQMEVKDVVFKPLNEINKEVSQTAEDEVRKLQRQKELKSEMLRLYT